MCMPSRMTAIFNPFSEALRRPQITEMCDLVCSGCIGRYGQWAWDIRDPFGWLGQWFQSTRRNVSGWLQRHKSIEFETWLDIAWYSWCKRFLMRLLSSLEHILFLWHGWDMLGSILGSSSCFCVPGWMSAGAFKRPFFGNGEAPFWGQ